MHKRNRRNLNINHQDVCNFALAHLRGDLVKEVKKRCQKFISSTFYTTNLMMMMCLCLLKSRTACEQQWDIPCHVCVTSKHKKSVKMWENTISIYYRYDLFINRTSSHSLPYCCLSYCCCCYYRILIRFCLLISNTTSPSSFHFISTYWFLWFR